jgi:ABC-type multidrug transport system fused ATPase/permease subunit
MSDRTKRTDKADRNTLLDYLQRRNESQLEELRLRLGVDKFHLRWSGVTLNQQAIDLIEYLEQQEAGLQRLQELLERDKSDVPIPECPYRGLFAFQEEHAEFFFGRSTFINDLVQAVKIKPLVAVVGASGSGSSYGIG